MLGLIRRSFSNPFDISIWRDLNLYLVLSQLLYWSLIWRPYVIKDIKLLEQVQRRATKYILNDYLSYYKICLVSLKILPLMILLELNDLSFLLRMWQPFSFFDILNYVRFSHSSTRFSSK